MEIKITNADGLANYDSKQPTLIVLDISRHEIETENFTSALERLHVLTDSQQNVYRYKESMVFQVRGYDEDPRELPEIPQVRRYFALLTKQWPHWFWFLLRGNGCVVMLLALLCVALLCEVKIHRNNTGQLATEFLNKENINNVVSDLMLRGNALFTMYDIDASVVETSANSAINELLEQ